MAAPRSSSALLLLLSLSILLLLPAALAQSAPAPAPSGPPNITGILDQAGGYSSFIRLLVDTHTDTQIDNQVNNSRDGMTIFAPTDNAFNNLAPGTLNNLTNQQQVQLVQYHICPKYYSMADFRSVSNPVKTQASGQDNKVFGLYITSQANQINVSTGIVVVPVYNSLTKNPPLAVYQVDKVLVPREFSEASPPEASPPAPPSNSTRRGSSSGGGGAAAAAPSTENPAGNGAGKMNLGLGLASGICLFLLGLLI